MTPFQASRSSNHPPLSDEGVNRLIAEIFISAKSDIALLESASTRRCSHTKARNWISRYREIAFFLDSPATSTLLSQITSNPDAVTSHLKNQLTALAPKLALMQSIAHGTHFLPPHH